MTFLSLADNTSLGEMFGVSGLGFGIVVTVLAVLAIFVVLISKVFGGRKKATEDKPQETKAEAPATVDNATAILDEPTLKLDEDKAIDEPEIPHIPGYVVLDGVSEQDAAVVMAITSHNTGIDLERLDFKRIKRLNQNPELINIEEQDAAAIMAITSDKTGIPLENLIFNSIKLVED
jgi:Na+-transporting methylmalonyl-CoA/oxaloacetate decarboxylase gamma subunit